MNRNTMTQIGLAVLVGLAAKNATLVVEFARDAEAQAGSDSVTSVAGACRL